MKKILSFVLVTLLLVSVGCGAKNEVTVSVEIDCSDILNNYDLLDEALQDEKYVPADGKILEKTEFTVQEGERALDILKAVAKENDIQVDIADRYAKGINYIYEKSCGEYSGWVYEINGEWAMEEYTATEGDIITWKYICDFNSVDW